MNVALEVTVQDFQVTVCGQINVHTLSIYRDFLPRLASAFEVDRLLRRTVLFLIPVWQLDEVAVTRLFPISDLCVALTTFIPRVRVLKEKVWNIFLG